MYQKILLSFVLFALTAKSEKPVVLVSIPPYQTLVEKIGGDSLTVKTIVPVGANPHTFEPTARQASQTVKATLWLRIGEPFEEKLTSFLEGQKTAPKVYDLRDGVHLIGAHEGGCSCHEKDHLDRHLWLSTKELAIQAEKVASVFTSHFPEKKEFFEANLAAYKQELQETDAEIQKTLKPLKDRLFITSHGAFAYFCRDYSLEQLSVEFEGKDPRPKHVESIFERALNGHAKTALELPQYNNKGVSLIAKKLNLDLKWIDPYSPDSLKTMRHLAQLLVDEDL
jgi:zinc transport system substrate-binding protein